MPKVLVHGATGAIGNTFAQHLVRSGNHTVWGIARNEEKARNLAALEIRPVVCADPLNDPKTWLDLLRSERIDIVVDAASYYHETLKVLDHVKAFGQERSESALDYNIVLPQKIGFLYVSGMWVHGDSMKKVSDIDPVGDAGPTLPVELVAARPGWEQAILKSNEVLDVAIVRPAMVYGGNSWIMSPMFAPIHNAKGASTVQVPATETSWPSFVHVDDLAAGMQAVVEKLPLLAGSNAYPVFDFATSQEKLAEVVKAAATSFGYEGKLEFTGPGDNGFFKAMNTSSNLDSSRAKMLLGWEPKRIGIMANMDTYVVAWKAHQSS